MSEFNFKSQICTSREQSERLLALGLKKETADCALFLNGNNEFEQLSKFGNWEKYADMLPAWSLHRLIEIVPSTINKMLWFTITPYTAFYDSVDYIKSFDSKDNLYDNIIDCIEWLIKEGYFNKEYLV
jgi:hypothetical protein